MSGNVHANHRERMRMRLMDKGADSLLDHEMLEILLYSSMPRKDTNPVAHRLLKHFGSLHRVLEAHPRDLMIVEEVGEITATQLYFTYELMRRYQQDLNRDIATRVPLRSPDLIAQFFIPLLSNRTEEVVLLACLDAQRRVIQCKEICIGTPVSTDVHAWQIAQAAIQQKAACVVLAHNHPGGIAMPSSQDIRTTIDLKNKLAGVGVALVEHVVVAHNSFILLSDLGIFAR